LVTREVTIGIRIRGGKTYQVHSKLHRCLPVE
jgi:hypothetical protein